MKLPPPLTPGIQDFLGAAAAATANLLGDTAVLAAIGADNKIWAFLPPFKNAEEPNPFTNAADVEAIFLSVNSLSLSPPRQIGTDTDTETGLYGLSGVGKSKGLI